MKDQIHKNDAYAEFNNDLIIGPNRPIYIDKNKVLEILDKYSHSPDVRYIIEEIEKL